MLDPVRPQPVDTAPLDAGRSQPPPFVRPDRAAAPNAPAPTPAGTVRQEIALMIQMLQDRPGSGTWIQKLEQIQERLSTSGDWVAAAYSLDHLREVLLAFDRDLTNTAARPATWPRLERPADRQAAGQSGQGGQGQRPLLQRMGTKFVEITRHLHGGEALSPEMQQAYDAFLAAAQAVEIAPTLQNLRALRTMHHNFLALRDQGKAPMIAARRDNRSITPPR